MCNLKSSNSYIFKKSKEIGKINFNNVFGPIYPKYDHLTRNQYNIIVEILYILLLHFFGIKCLKASVYLILISHLILD